MAGGNPPDVCAEGVGIYRPVRAGCACDTEAAVYSGQEAIDAGLADELVNSTDAITVMRDALDARNPVSQRANDQRDSINNCFSHCFAG
ncbi:S49 family peptidase [Escherichia coli]|nr:S49 family peptidase [Escherichia coli]